MIGGLKPSLYKSWKKNRSELRAIATRRMPAFVWGGSVGENEIPVFVFHDVEPQSFEAQLRYLADNDYLALSATEFQQALETRNIPRRSVLLTFDDARWSFWSFALPLLEKYQMPAILFVIPGPVQIMDIMRPQIGDGTIDRESEETLKKYAVRWPLCTLGELEEICSNSLITIGCHSFSHQLIPVSPHAFEFVHPDFDPGPFANSDLPIVDEDDPRYPKRCAYWGRPILPAASRLKGRNRWIPPKGYSEHMRRYVDARGGGSFFSDSNWRQNLLEQHRKLLRVNQGSWETAADRDQAIRNELEFAENGIRDLSLGYEVTHFCYPWFEGCERVDAMLRASDYRFLHYGPDHLTRPLANDAWHVQRLNDDYIWALPGQGRRSLIEIIRNRKRRRAKS